MSRSGYCDDYGDDDPLALGRYRAQVNSAIRGKRGQALLRRLTRLAVATVLGTIWSGLAIGLGLLLVFMPTSAFILPAMTTG